MKSQLIFCMGFKNSGKGGKCFRMIQMDRRLRSGLINNMHRCRNRRWNKERRNVKDRQKVKKTERYRERKVKEGK